MRVALIAMMVALLTVPAYAQGIGGRGGRGGKQDQSEGKQSQSEIAEQKKKAKEAEEAYKAALKKIPDKKISNDPWQNVR